jgi:hypothetical protein
MPCAMIQGETLPEMNPELIVRAEESHDPSRNRSAKDNVARLTSGICDLCADSDFFSFISANSFR